MRTCEACVNSVCIGVVEWTRIHTVGGDWQQLKGDLSIIYSSARAQCAQPCVVTVLPLCEVPFFPDAAGNPRKAKRKEGNHSPARLATRCSPFSLFVIALFHIRYSLCSFCISIFCLLCDYKHTVFTFFLVGNGAVCSSFLTLYKMCDPNGFPASWRSCTRRQAILTSPKATSLSRWRGGAGAAKPKVIHHRWCSASVRCNG